MSYDNDNQLSIKRIIPKKACSDGNKNVTSLLLQTFSDMLLLSFGILLGDDDSYFRKYLLLQSC